MVLPCLKEGCVQPAKRGGGFCKQHQPSRRAKTRKRSIFVISKSFFGFTGQTSSTAEAVQTNQPTPSHLSPDRGSGERDRRKATTSSARSPEVWLANWNRVVKEERVRESLPPVDPFDLALHRQFEVLLRDHCNGDVAKLDRQFALFVQNRHKDSTPHPISPPSLASTSCSTTPRFGVSGSKVRRHRRSQTHAGEIQTPRSGEEHKPHVHWSTLFKPRPPSHEPATKPSPKPAKPTKRPPARPYAPDKPPPPKPPQTGFLPPAHEHARNNSTSAPPYRGSEGKRVRHRRSLTMGTFPTNLDLGGLARPLGQTVVGTEKGLWDASLGVCGDSERQLPLPHPEPPEALLGLLEALAHDEESSRTRTESLTARGGTGRFRLKSRRRSPSPKRSMKMRREKPSPQPKRSAHADPAHSLYVQVLEAWGVGARSGRNRLPRSYCRLSCLALDRPSAAAIRLARSSQASSRAISESYSPVWDEVLIVPALPSAWLRVEVFDQVGTTPSLLDPAIGLGLVCMAHLFKQQEAGQTFGTTGNPGSQGWTLLLSKDLEEGLGSLYLKCMLVAKDPAKRERALSSSSSSSITRLSRSLRGVSPPPPPSMTISVAVGSWNVGNAQPPNDLSQWLRPGTHDVYVVGTQECKYAVDEKRGFSGCKDEWRARLLHHFGREYRIISLKTLWEIRIAVLVRARLAHFVNGLEHHKEATGIAQVMGNKGGVITSFSFGHTPMAFVCAHLAAHRSEVLNRNLDVRAIFTHSRVGQCRRSIVRPVQPDLCHQFHHLFFFGDLNYRIDYPESNEDTDPNTPSDAAWSTMDTQIRTSIVARRKLFEEDQLAKEMKAGRVFHGFQEGDVAAIFPTFKVEHGSVLRYSQRRAPAWCDRILWRSQPGLNVHLRRFVSSPSVPTSDHKPVMASFRVPCDLLAASCEPLLPPCSVQVYSIRAQGLVGVRTRREAEIRDRKQGGAATNLRLSHHMQKMKSALAGKAPTDPFLEQYFVSFAGPCLEHPLVTRLMRQKRLESGGGVWLFPAAYPTSLLVRAASKGQRLSLSADPNSRQRPEGGLSVSRQHSRSRPSSTSRHSRHSRSGSPQDFPFHPNDEDDDDVSAFGQCYNDDEESSDVGDNSYTDQPTTDTGLARGENLVSLLASLPDKLQDSSRGRVLHNNPIRLSKEFVFVDVMDVNGQSVAHASLALGLVALGGSGREHAANSDGSLTYWADFNLDLTFAGVPAGTLAGRLNLRWAR